MPSIYKYYNSDNSTYTFSIINKPLSSKITKLQLGDSSNTISTTSNSNQLNISSSIILQEGKSFQINGTSTPSFIVSQNKVAINGDINSSYTFDVTGNANISTDLYIGRDLTVVDDLSINNGQLNIGNSNFTVTASSGDTTIKGDLDLTKNLTINTNKFKVTALTGDTEIAGSLSVTSFLSVTGAFLGRVPLGGIIPILPVFQLTDNSGSKTTSGIPSSGSLTSDGFQLCDGSLVNSGANSNFTTKYVPNLTDDRFIKGSTLANIGIIGKDNNASLIEANLPNHSHTISHTHSGTTGDDSPDHSHGIERTASTNSYSSGNFPYAYNTLNQIATPREQTLGASNRHQHGFTTSSPSNSSSGTTGSGTSFDITPKYINAVYLMRVK